MADGASCRPFWPPPSGRRLRGVQKYLPDIFVNPLLAMLEQAYILRKATPNFFPSPPPAVPERQESMRTAMQNLREGV